jgi:hypothetical protein
MSEDVQSTDTGTASGHCNNYKNVIIIKMGGLL